jgi:uncharacterized membrane protein/Zn ribbon nucleic-acid-binding protein
MSALDIALLALVAAGILLTTYLTYVAWFEVHPAFCTEGSECDLVQSSRWSTLLGLPIAFWGLLTYVVMAKLIWRGRTKPGSLRLLIFVAVCGFVISAYLTVISVVEIEATCPYCLASFAIITAIMVLTLVRRPPEWFTSLKEAAVIGVLIVGVLHMHYSGLFDAAAGPENPRLKALALHLADTGATFYGAYWCPRCQEQKALFGASEKRLPYVECTPSGRTGPQNSACVAKNVNNYPTWIIDGRRYSGIQTTRSLEKASRFTWKE